MNNWSVVLQTINEVFSAAGAVTTLIILLIRKGEKPNDHDD
jgi:hypothetical protein